MTETQNEGKKVSIFTKINYIFDKKQKGQLHCPFAGGLKIY